MQTIITVIGTNCSTRKKVEGAMSEKKIKNEIADVIPPEISPYKMERFIYLPVHRDQELLVALGILHMILDEIHRFNRVHIRKVITQYPYPL